MLNVCSLILPALALRSLGHTPLSVIGIVSFSQLTVPTGNLVEEGEGRGGEGRGEQ